MTFGKLNSFYACMLAKEKEEVANSFSLSAADFKSMIDFIADLRNKCAHGERIYCHSKDQRVPRPIPDTPHHKTLTIPRNRKGYKYGKCDILALLIAMKYFLHPDRFDKLIYHIDYALNEKLKKRLRSIHCSDIGYCERRKRGFASGQGLELCRAGHAEANAIDQCARRGTSCAGATLYVTTQPCVFCCIHIIQAGIKKVIFKGEYPTGLGLELLQESGVEYVKYEDALEEERRSNEEKHQKEMERVNEFLSRPKTY